VLENDFVSSKGWVKPGQMYPFTLRVLNYGSTPLAGARVTLSDLQNGYTDANGEKGYVSDDQSHDLEGRALFWTDSGRIAKTTNDTGIPVYTRVGDVSFTTTASCGRFDYGNGAVSEGVPTQPPLTPPTQQQRQRLRPRPEVGPRSSCR
jgi:hypothetical protein